MAEMKVTVSEIKELMDRMSANHLTEISLKLEGFELSLKTEQKEVVREPEAAVSVKNTMSTQVQTTIAAAEEASGHVVKSPLVGTFYAGAALDKPPFTAVGKRVSKGDTLFIIESMKLMNEVQSEFDGVVSKIMIESGQGVEFGQPILIIE